MGLAQSPRSLTLEVTGSLNSLHDGYQTAAVSLDVAVGLSGHHTLLSESGCASVYVGRLPFSDGDPSLRVPW